MNKATRQSSGWVRNFLVVCGIYWLSEWLAVLVGLAAGITHATVYSETVLSAVYMGALVSWERTLAAILAGAAVTLIVPSRRFWVWALLIAALYAVDYRTHSHWAVPPTTWDRLSMRAEHFFPAVACIVAAFVTAWLRRKQKSATVQSDG